MSEDLTNDLKAKILTVIERVGATDMAAEIIIDLVKRGLGRMGGRPPNNRLSTPSKPVTNGVETPATGVSSDPISDPSSPESPDPSKPDREDPVSDGQGSLALVPFPPQKNVFGKALAQFCEIWRTRYGVYYEPTAADRNQLGRLLKGLSPAALEELPRAFRAYLGDLSPFVAQEMRHSLRYFCTSGGMNKYRASAPVLSAKEARGHAAGEQWEAMTNGRK